MKKQFNKFITLSAVLLILIGFNSCEEDNDYNYDKIVPVVFGVNGATSVAAHGLTDYPYTYEVSYYRGGSTFAWTVTTVTGVGEATIVLEDVLEAKGKIAKITFPQRSVADEATVTVVETTLGGVASEPYSFTVTLNAFCPYPMDDFAGDYTGTIPHHAPTVTMETTDNLNELKVYGLGYFVPTYWGENWVVGDGSCVMEFSCGDVVTIKPQWIGDSDYPDVYGIIGSGTVDVDAKVITLDYEVFWGWDGSTGTSCFGVLSTTLTLDGKMLEFVKELQVKNK